MMYDIFLQHGCSSQPDLSHVMEQVPVLEDSYLQACIVQKEQAPGFLGLDLSASLASMLLECLIVAGAVGYRLLSTYRTPTLSIGQAKVYATHVLTQQWNEKFPETPFSQSLNIIDRGVCWQFEVKEGAITLLFLWIN
ncbi:hypothetical protein [Dictyobacter kobayashii]|uniref:Uncharacterized protein n=1 Tax=Dictyobacter kobayashii TaxID=2014872 RepID=A0A402AVX6_9CHLR|nr:hypothetical protein [Dictyobacter kobayashii]GCE23183.1 hypothetical protein KDK_69830 [Dictyobacter kobayashii]